MKISSHKAVLKPMATKGKELFTRNKGALYKNSMEIFFKGKNIHFPLSINAASSGAVCNGL